MNIDQSLDNLENTVYEMATLVIKQHKKVVETIQKKDKEIALSIIKKDDHVNRMEEEINNLAIAEFALLSPLATDLRRTIVAIKVASELERIGDYAKTFASFIIKDRDVEEDTLMDMVVELEENAIEMLENAIESYKNRDLNIAFSIPEKNKEIIAKVRAFKDRMIESETVTKKQAFYLAELLRNVNRTKDHTINICEHVVYLQKGVQYEFD